MNFFYWGGSGLSDRGQCEAPLDPIIKTFQLYFRVKLVVYMVLLMAYSLWHVAGKIKQMADGKWPVALGQICTIGLNGVNFLAKLPKGIQAVLTLVCIVSMFTVSAQELPGNQRAANGPVDIKALKIGGSVPDGFWTYEHLLYIEGDTVRRSLAEYKGKLLVLDFWATWCASCVEAFPKLEDLRSHFGSEVVFLLPNPRTTRDSLPKVKKTAVRFEEQHSRALKLPLILEDTVLSGLFPHRLLPHVVWIDKDGRVAAQTYAAEVNIDNISILLNGDKPTFHMKDDFAATGAVRHVLDTLQLFHSSFSRYTEGLGNKAPTLKDDSAKWVYNISNYKLPFYFVTAYIHEGLGRVARGHWIFDADIDNVLVQSIKFPRRYKDQYCYTLIYDKGLGHLTPEEMLKMDLARVFDLKVAVQKKKMEVYVLRAKEAFDRVTSSSELSIWQASPQDRPKYVRGMLFTSLMEPLGAVLPGPVVLETPPGRLVDLDLPEDIYAFDERQMLDYLTGIGIEVVKEHREITVALFSKAGKYRSTL